MPTREASLTPQEQHALRSENRTLNFLRWWFLARSTPTTSGLLLLFQNSNLANFWETKEYHAEPTSFQGKVETALNQVGELTLEEKILLQMLRTALYHESQKNLNNQLKQAETFQDRHTSITDYANQTTLYSWLYDALRKYTYDVNVDDHLVKATMFSMLCKHTVQLAPR